MPLLANVTLDVWRSSNSPTSHVTSAPLLYLSGVSAHIMPNQTPNYKTLPVAALQSDYVATVDSGIDVREGDVLKNILQNDGTPWPSIAPSTNTNEYFSVVYAAESTPEQLLQHRKVYISRVRGGGPVY
jgi:hypothetical protein